MMKARCFYRLLLAVEHHATVIEHVINEFPIGGEAGVIPVFDIVVGYPVAPLISAFTFAACLVVTVVGQQLMANLAIFGYPHAHIRMLCHRVIACFSDCLGCRRRWHKSDNASDDEGMFPINGKLGVLHVISPRSKRLLGNASERDTCDVTDWR